MSNRKRLLKKINIHLARVIEETDKPLKESESKTLLRLIKAKFEDYISVTKRIPPEIVSTVDSLMIYQDL